LSVPGRPASPACAHRAQPPDTPRRVSTPAMTAQHAVRQGALVANNIAASYSIGRAQRRAYRHRDLGFVVDLGGTQAAANPFGIRLSGLPAKAVTRGYHLLSMPANRIRIATDWALDAVLPRQLVQVGLMRGDAVPLTADTPEHPAEQASASAREGG